MDPNMTLEKRIDAELYSYQGRMSVFVDDLQGHTVERGADEEFETLQINVIIIFYFIHCHNRLEFETAITSCVSELLNTSVIEITVTVENHCRNTCCDSVSGYELTNLSSLLLLRHLLETER